MSHNRINNVAIVGATGNSGSFMTKYLLEKGKSVTALTRAGSKASLPSEVKVKPIDYEDQTTIVDALHGQDALVITLSPMAPKDTQDKLIKAAAEAKVEWVLPNEWSPDTVDEGFAKDIVGFRGKQLFLDQINALGLKYIAVSTGFWYEYSLAIPAAFGFDLQAREVTLFDEGTTKITTSTWPQVGRAVAGLLGLPIEAEGGNEHCLQQLKNKVVYVGSFTVCQKDMLESAIRVTKTRMEDWKITKEPAEQRYKHGAEAMKAGDRMGFVRHMYTRVFFSDGAGNHEERRGLINGLLGLPEEDLDEATKVAIQRQKDQPFS